MEDQRPGVFLNYLDTDREVIEPKPLHEISEIVLRQLEEEDNLEEFSMIADETKAGARAKGFLDRLFVFKKMYSRKKDGEVEYFSKSLAYPPADVVNDLFFALESR